MCWPSLIFFLSKFHKANRGLTIYCKCYACKTPHCVSQCGIRLRAVAYRVESDSPLYFCQSGFWQKVSKMYTNYPCIVCKVRFFLWLEIGRDENQKILKLYTDYKKVLANFQ